MKAVLGATLDRNGTSLVSRFPCGLVCLGLLLFPMSSDGATGNESRHGNVAIHGDVVVYDLDCDILSGEPSSVCFNSGGWKLVRNEFAVPLDPAGAKEVSPSGETFDPDVDDEGTVFPDYWLSGDIFLDDHQGNLLQLSKNGCKAMPAIYGKLVAWEDRCTGDRFVEVHDLDAGHVVWSTMTPGIEEMLPTVFDGLVFAQRQSGPLPWGYDVVWGKVSGSDPMDSLGKPGHRPRRAPHAFLDKVVYEEANRSTDWQIRYHPLDKVHDLSIDSEAVFDHDDSPEEIARRNCHHFFQPRVGGEKGELVVFSGYNHRGDCSGLDLFVYDMERKTAKWIAKLGFRGPDPITSWAHHEDRPHYDISGNRIVYAVWDGGMQMYTVHTFEYEP